MIVLEIPFDVSCLSPNRTTGKHWRATKRTKGTIGDAVYYAWLSHTRPPDLPWSPVTIHIHRHGTRRMDPDNLIAACKIAIDTLTLAGIIPDDGPAHVASITTEQTTGRKIEKKTIFTIRKEATMEEDE